MRLISDEFHVPCNVLHSSYRFICSQMINLGRSDPIWSLEKDTPVHVLLEC